METLNLKFILVGFFWTVSSQLQITALQDFASFQLFANDNLRNLSWKLVNLITCLHFKSKLTTMEASLWVSLAMSPHFKSSFALETFLLSLAMLPFFFSFEQFSWVTIISPKVNESCYKRVHLLSTLYL